MQSLNCTNQKSILQYRSKWSLLYIVSLYLNKPFTADEEEWNIVIIKCSSLAAKWEQLSAYLGLSMSMIDRIKANRHGDCAACWNEALKEWIMQNYNAEKFGKPSWKVLLRNVAHFDKLLFKKLVEEHQLEGI